VSIKISLCLVIERGADPGYATRAIQTAARKKGRFVWLTPPSSLGAITVADVQAVSTAAEHKKRVQAWAESAWSAWSMHHRTIHGWLETRGFGGENKDE
jgi:hypothetical protein